MCASTQMKYVNRRDEKPPTQTILKSTISKLGDK